MPGLNGDPCCGPDVMINRELAALSISPNSFHLCFLSLLLIAWLPFNSFLHSSVIGHTHHVSSPFQTYFQILFPSCIIFYFRQRRRYMFSPARPSSFVCLSLRLSVCLSVCKITRHIAGGPMWLSRWTQHDGHGVHCKTTTREVS